jgi:serpin B
MKKLLFSLLATSLAATAQADPAVAATNAGGVKIFQVAERENPGNLCISPFSIQSALAMTYAGADGTTRSQMAAALEFPEDPSVLAAGFEALNASLQQAATQSGKDTALRIANRLFGAKGFAFRKAFQEICRSRFGAPLEELNFRANPSAAADHINAWVEKQTEARIRNLIPAGALTNDTTLVLANALCLKIRWAEEFVKLPDLPFLVNGKARRNVPTIAHTDFFSYRKAAGFTAVGVPFSGGQFQFLILLPDKQATPLTAALLATSAHLPKRDVSLYLPKFRIEPPTLSLGKILQSLGMKSAFDIPSGSANFDGIAPRQPDDYLCISKVFHKTFFALDENGIEAAAATAVAIRYASAMPARRNPVEVRVDRPFYFAVQHTPTGTCLFLGKITDPR